MLYINLYIITFGDISFIKINCIIMENQNQQINAIFVIVHSIEEYYYCKETFDKIIQDFKNNTINNSIIKTIPFSTIDIEKSLSFIDFEFYADEKVFIKQYPNKLKFENINTWINLNKVIFIPYIKDISIEMLPYFARSFSYDMSKITKGFRNINKRKIEKSFEHIITSMVNINKTHQKY